MLSETARTWPSTLTVVDTTTWEKGKPKESEKQGVKNNNQYPVVAAYKSSVIERCRDYAGQALGVLAKCYVD